MLAKTSGSRQDLSHLERPLPYINPASFAILPICPTVPSVSIPLTFRSVSTLLSIRSLSPFFYDAHAAGAFLVAGLSRRSACVKAWTHDPCSLSIESVDSQNSERQESIAHSCAESSDSIKCHPSLLRPSWGLIQRICPGHDVPASAGGSDPSGGGGLSQRICPGQDVPSSSIASFSLPPYATEAGLSQRMCS